MPDIHRLLPQDAEAEKALLSCLAISPAEIFVLCGQHEISTQHFHIPAHAHIFSALSSMAVEGKPIDFVTLLAELKKSGVSEQSGGAALISELFTFGAGLVGNTEYYIEILREKHLARELIRIGTKYAAKAYDDTENASELAAEAHSQFTALLTPKKTRKTIKESIIEIVRELQSGTPDGEIVRTGVAEVDAKLDLYRGDLLVITAPTSCGKSALANQMLITAAVELKSRVAFYPLEMRKKQTLKRALAVRSGNNPKYVRTLLLNAKTEEATRYANQAFAKLSEACSEIVQAPIHMRDDLHTLEGILADIRAESARGQFDLIAIDYLQLIRCAGKFERRQLQIAEITQRLKIAANELNCVIIVPSQQNKDGGTREAQDAENDASALIKIHPDEDAEDIQPGRIEIWKQREGARHVNLALTFNGLLTRFEASK